MTSVPSSNADIPATVVPPPTVEVATIYSFPPEVLSQIFLVYFSLCRPSFSADPFTDIRIANKAHITILQICRRWNTIALGDPRLWTTIPIVAAQSNILEWHRDYQCTLQRRIKHTSALSLRLLFYLVPDSTLSKPRDVIPLLRTFFSLLYRARSIAFDISSLQTTTTLEWTAFIDSIQVPTVKDLHSAKLYLGDESLGRRLVSSMPNVEVLTIKVPGNTRCIIDGSNVSHRLRSLDIRCGTIALKSLLAILKGAQLLKTLKVCRVAEPTGNVGHYQFGIITHPLLSSFLVSSSTTTDNVALFNHITFPALRRLDVTAAADDEPHVWPLPCNIVFLRRSGCRLTKLIIRNYVIDDDRITELLSSQQELVALRLNASGDDTRHVEPPGRTRASLVRYQMSISPNVLGFICQGDDGHTIPLPCLKRLQVALTPVVVTFLSCMVRSRLGRFASHSGVAILDEIQLLIMRHGVGDIQIPRDQFEALTDAGVRLSVAYVSVQRT